MSTIPKYRICILAFIFEGQYAWLLTSLQATVSAEIQTRRKKIIHVIFMLASPLFPLCLL